MTGVKEAEVDVQGLKLKVQLLTVWARQEDHG